MMEDSPLIAAAPVLVPMPAERPYTYAVPAGMRGGAGLDRARAARSAPGCRHRLGRRGRKGRCQKSCARSSRSSTARRSTATCVVSSTGSRSTRCRRPAWWRACCCGRRRPSTRSPGSRACSALSAEPDRMTAARTRVLETAEDGLAWTRVRAGACGRRVVDRHRRAERARRVRDRHDPAADRWWRHPTRATPRRR